MRRLILLFRSNWISAFGAVVTTLAFMGFVTTWIYLSLHGSSHGPYLGMFAFIGLPMVFVAGLLLIPVGLLVYRNQLRQRMDLLTHKPFRLVRFIVLLTLINVAVAGTAGYEAVHFMDSQQFCGSLCHEVMSPTYDTYLDSPHARVRCVECHIGPGASGFVKAKVSGLRRVAAVLFDTSRRPIPTPVHDMAPTEDTCEQCHWPERYVGDRLVVRHHFADDEVVSGSTNVVLMRIGGTRPDGSASGIHWHVHPGSEVSYISTDDSRTKIPWVKLTDADGKERIFTVEDVDPKGAPPPGQVRTMNCVDCHNQPSHRFQDRKQAMDEGIASGVISRRLPFVRKVGLEALEQVWTRENAREGIRQHLDRFYAGNGSLPADVQALIGPASEAIADIWMRNIHPAMNITWGTYRDFIGHDGCMRCHDGEHLDADGESITADCESCHATLAEKESDPDVLKRFGIGGR